MKIAVAISIWLIVSTVFLSLAAYSQEAQTTNIVTIAEGTQAILLTNHTTIRIQSSAAPKAFNLAVNSARPAKVSPLYLKLPNLRTAKIFSGDIVIFRFTYEAGEWVAERMTE